MLSPPEHTLADQEACFLVTNDRATDDEPRWARVERVADRGAAPQAMMAGTVTT